MPFDSPDVNLGTLLRDVSLGKVQLPDFQRSWKWDVDRVASLIASVSLGHPVGVVMMLELGGDEVRFKPRVLEGVDEAAAGEPEQLVLDGQQRLTSLYQSIFSGQPVDTFDARGKRMKRWYYIDIGCALDPDADREEAIVAVPEDRVVRSNFGRDVVTDFSTVEREVAAEAFPLAKVYDNAAIFAWQNAYLRNSRYTQDEAIERFNRFFNEVLNNFLQYTVPVIVLKKSTPKEAVCTVFEKVNTGGVPLNVFELLTATFAADDFRLNEDWEVRKRELGRRPVLKTLESTDFLQAICLVVSARRRVAALAEGAEQIPAVSCRRKDILKLALADYRATATEVTQGFSWASQFLSMQKVFRADDVPYRTQLVPLAALSALLGSRVTDVAASEKIERWYWCGVLGELYGGATETRFARDLEQLPVWIDGGREPRTVADASFETSRLFTMRTRNSAAYKGVHALLMRDGCRDWMKAIEIDMASFFSQSIDIHHVFPRKWCDDNDVDPADRDSIVNKTPLSYDTNRSLGGRAPSDYLATIRERTQLGPDALTDRLAQHSIDLETLRDDDFERFFERRTEALAGLIARAMGKDVVEDHILPEEAGGAYEATVVGTDDPGTDLDPDLDSDLASA